MGIVEEVVRDMADRKTTLCKFVGTAVQALLLVFWSPWKFPRNSDAGLQCR